MPKIFMREHIDEAGRTVRELVDGQQRIRSILSYLNNGFRVMRAHGGEQFGGRYYEGLDAETQRKFLQYDLSVDVLIGASDTEVLDIFARLNTYGVRLNKQELLNAQYFGDFKRTVYDLGYEFNTFWTFNRVLSEAQITRMLEAELTGELIIAMVDGIQSRKVVGNYYRRYDDEFPDRDKVQAQFKGCMDLVGEITDGGLADSNFRSSHMFYTLYCAIYDLFYGLPGSTFGDFEAEPRTLERIRNSLWDVDELLNEDQEFLEGDRLSFVQAATRRTTDLRARNTRHDYLVDCFIKSIRGFD